MPYDRARDGEKEQMTTTERDRISLKVADEVWLVTALLHREQADRIDFAVNEIVERAERELIVGHVRPGVRVHALLHCVANLAPNPARHRMLFATGKLTRRLYREGDPYHPSRKGKIVPAREDVPAEYRDLLEWYHSEYASRKHGVPQEDPLLALRGSGRSLWSDEHADDYVRRLREGWE